MMKILYICTHNRCRSILSEAITRQLAGGLIEARSAGSSPVGAVHPLSLRYLSARGYAIANLHSQSWNDFAQFAPDLVITVCDAAAAETCPMWFEECLQLHWGLSDPSKCTGSAEVIESAFNRCIDAIEARVHKLSEIALRPRADWAELLKELVHAQA